MIGKKVYLPNNKIYGTITDLVFENDGSLLLLVISKLVIPVLGVGILRKFVVPKTLIKYRNGYMLTTMHDNLKIYLALKHRIYNIVRKLEKYYKYHDVLVLTLLTMVLMMLLLIMIFFKEHYFIALLITLSYVTLLPKILLEAYKINLTGLLSYTSLVGSKAYDINRNLLGMISDIKIDIKRNRITHLVISKYLIAKEEVRNALYRSKTYIEIKINLVKEFRRDSILLKTSFNELKHFSP